MSSCGKSLFEKKKTNGDDKSWLGYLMTIKSIINVFAFDH